MLGKLYEKIDNLGKAIAGLSKAIDKQTDESTRRFDQLESKIEGIRESQLARRNGNGAAAAASTAVKKTAAPAGFAGLGAAAAELIRYLVS